MNKQAEIVKINLLHLYPQVNQLLIKRNMAFAGALPDGMERATSFAAGSLLSTAYNSVGAGLKLLGVTKTVDLQSLGGAVVESLASDPQQTEKIEDAANLYVSEFSNDEVLLLDCNELSRRVLSVCNPPARAKSEGIVERALAESETVSESHVDVSDAKLRAAGLCNALSIKLFTRAASWCAASDGVPEFDGSDFARRVKDAVARAKELKGRFSALYGQDSSGHPDNEDKGNVATELMKTAGMLLIRCQECLQLSLGLIPQSMRAQFQTQIAQMFPQIAESAEASGMPVQAIVDALVEESIKQAMALGSQGTSLGSLVAAEYHLELIEDFLRSIELELPQSQP